MTLLEALIIAGVVFLSLLLTGRAALYVTVVTTLVQLFVGPVSAGAVVPFGLVAGELVRRAVASPVSSDQSAQIGKMRGRGVALSGLIICSSVFAVVLSRSPSMGFTYVKQIIVAVLLVYLFAGHARRDLAGVILAVRLAVTIAALGGVSAIVFRLYPAVEYAYLRSPAADLILGPSARALFLDSANNVLDPAKAGGLFYVNGNVASMLFGMAACVILGLGSPMRSWARTAFVLLVVSVVATGSKTGVILAIVMVPLALLVRRAEPARMKRLVLPLLLVAPVVALVVVRSVEHFVPGFYSRAEQSSLTRGAMWGYARDRFVDAPLLGLGFGGWELEAWRDLGISYPPHNWVIAAWVYGGVLLVCASLLYAVWALRLPLALLAMPESDVATRAFGAAGASALAWCFVHGMFDNTALYGESRSVIFFALIAGVALALAEAHALRLRVAFAPLREAAA